ncbi:MAG: hypothetical protein HYV42_03710 [Candidatus Magasanikbacteria bacterium]|nr:hypothetical protein [Candidatus Magasanikbacteria bacterium]
MPNSTNREATPAEPREESIEVVAETEEERRAAALQRYQELLALRATADQLPRGHKKAEQMDKIAAHLAEIRALGFSEAQLAAEAGSAQPTTSPPEEVTTP